MNFNFSEILKLFDKALLDGVFSKAVAGFLFPDGSRKILAFKTPEDTIFDIASVTKVCPTAVLALKLILENKLTLDDLVVKYIPELQTNFKEEFFIRHLLTHAVDYRVRTSSLKEKSPDEILDFLCHYQFDKKPGTIFNYGNPANILLGIIIQRITGKRLDILAKEILFEPLEMKRSTYFPLKHFDKKEIAATEYCSFRKRKIQGEVHDESAFVLEQKFPVGSAGMFSCVSDLLNFSEMLLKDGLFKSRRILPPGILKLITTNGLESIQESASFGFELNANKFMGTKHSDKTFGKTGFTGASIVCDAKKQAAVVLLSDFTWPHRETNANRINQFRESLSDAFLKNFFEKEMD